LRFVVDDDDDSCRLTDIGWCGKPQKDDETPIPRMQTIMIIMWRRRLGVEAIVIGDEAILTGDLAVVENIEFGDKVISNSEAIWATRLL